MNSDAWGTILKSLARTRNYYAMDSTENVEVIEDIDAAIAEVEHMQLLSHQWPVRVSKDTLGAIEAMLDGDGNDATKAIVRMWLDRAWDDVNGVTKAVDHVPQPTIADFVQRVKVRAEQNMEANGTVSGAHWNAMRQVLKEMGIEVEI